MKKGGGLESTIIVGPSKSVLVYALNSLENVLDLGRFRVFVPNIYIYIQATSISVECNGKITISSVYCPSTFTITKDTFEEYFSSLRNKFVSCGDYNAEHTYWGFRLENLKENQLYKVSIDRLRFFVFRQPTYWPTNPRKNPDLIDFGITKNIHRDALSAKVSYDLCSDHAATIATYCGQTPIIKPLTNKIYQQYWLKYKTYISSHIQLGPALESKNDRKLC